MIKQRSLFLLILLSIITCGIYSVFFWYSYTKDINTVCEGDSKESPNFIVVILLSIITCGIYRYVWEYKQGNRLHEIASKYNLSFTENGTTILMWDIFGIVICGIGPWIAIYILIKNMNSIANTYNYNNSIQ